MLRFSEGNRWIPLVLAADIIAVGVIAAVFIDLRSQEDAGERTLSVEPIEAAGGSAQPELQLPAVPNFDSKIDSPTPPFVRPFAGQETAQGGVVRYSGFAFDPSVITVEDGSNRTGCLITFKNESDRTLLLRLGPFDQNDKRGFLYTPIAPGESGVIDPRYRNIPDPMFYDRNNPSATVLVHLLLTCQL